MAFKIMVKREKDVITQELEVQGNQNITWKEIVEYLQDNNSEIVQTLVKKDQKYAFYIANNNKLITDMNQQVLPVDEHPIQAIFLLEEQMYKYKEMSGSSKLAPLPINMPLILTQTGQQDDFHTDILELDQVFVKMKLSDDSNIQIQEKFSIRDKIGRINEYLIEAFGKDKSQVFLILRQVHFDLLYLDSVIGPTKYNREIGEVFKFDNNSGKLQQLELRVKIKYNGGCV